MPDETLGLIVVPPVNVFTPPKINVPVPDLTIEPLPLIVPLNVEDRLSLLPIVSELAFTLTAPAPSRALKVWFAPRDRVPVEATLTVAVVPNAPDGIGVERAAVDVDDGAEAQAAGLGERHRAGAAERDHAASAAVAQCGRASKFPRHCRRQPCYWRR